MSLQPVLLVGVGGSGSKALRTLRQTLLRRLRAVGWDQPDLPQAWQMVALDTVTIQGADGYPEELLPGSQYLGMVPPATDYGAIVRDLTGSLQPAMAQQAFGGWLEENIPTAIAFGAGQNRAVGRAVAAFALSDIKKRLDEAHHECQKPDALTELQLVAEKLSGDGQSINPSVLAFVITSVAGGTGSGMFVDVIESLTAIDTSLGMRAQVVLFGPDVFGPLMSGTGGGGIAANTLAAIASVTGGLWRETASAGTEALYQKKGLSVSKSGTGLIANCAGSRYNFVLGAVNAKGTPVGTMSEAYRAAGDSLAAMISDAQVMEDFRKFFQINTFENSWMPAVTGDESGLKPHEPRYTLPFASFGSAKVSLGSQRFAEYAAQSMTKATIKQLLWPTLEPDDPSDVRNDSTKIEEATSALWSTFLEESGLDERAERDDVVDALLSPQVTPLAQSTAASLISRAAAGAQGSNAAPAMWINNIQALVDSEFQKFIDETKLLRSAISRDWVDALQQRLLDLITQAATRSGIAVAASLVAKLKAEAIEVATQELPVEANAARRTIDELPGRLSALLTAGGLSSIPLNHPLIGEAQGIIAKAATFQEMADRFELAAALMLDLSENFLAPLHTSLSRGRSDLLARVNNDSLDDGRPNPFDDFPELGANPGKAFTPSPTELLLIETDQYPKLLERYAQNSLDNDAKDDWRNRLLQSVVSGRGLSGNQLVAPFFSLKQPWTTRVREARRQGAQLPAAAEFTTVVRPDQFLTRGMKIVGDQDTPLGRFTNQSLRDYLNTPDPADRNDREAKFISSLVQAFNIGAPLAEENHILIRELHPQLANGSGFNTVVSSIPVAQSDQLYPRLESALSQGGHWNANSSPHWFKNTSASEISIFQASRSAVSAMALTSLMEPVSTAWQKLRNSPSARESFWRMKRARPLIETIPIAPETLDAMVEGWFLAGILALREDDRPENHLGHRSQVWSIEKREWLSFPYPMLGTDGGGMKQLPGVIISVLLAMAECNHTSTLDPLRPYQQLIEFGQHFREDADDDPLTQWVKHGVSPSGAPNPDARRAGTSAASLDERKAAIVTTLDKSLDTFEKHFVSIEETGDPFKTDIAWEIRDLIRSAHRELRRRVAEIVDEDGIL